MSEKISSNEEGVEKNDVKIFVGNLDFKTNKESLAKLFSTFGDIIGVNIRTDRGTGKPRGFGFVTFDNVDSAQSAIREMNGKTVDNRALTVNLADIRGGDKSTVTERPAWLTAPDVREDKRIKAGPLITETIKDYSGNTTLAASASTSTSDDFTNVTKNKNGKKKNKKKQDVDNFFAPKSWTSWSGPA
jgi:cold-inducible RNA-binding protein